MRTHLILGERAAIVDFLDSYALTQVVGFKHWGKKIRLSDFPDTMLADIYQQARKKLMDFCHDEEKFIEGNQSQVQKLAEDFYVMHLMLKDERIRMHQEAWASLEQDRKN